MQPYINWTAVDAIAEVFGTFITALSIIILVCQTIRQTKQYTESTIRTEWYYLNAESQRLKKEADLIEGKYADERFSESRDRYIAIINQMHKLYDRHRKTLSDWPAPSETFPHLVEK